MGLKTKKVLSTAREIEDFGVVFTANDQLSLDELDDAVDIGIAVAPFIFACAARHLDEIPDEFHEFVLSANDGLQ